MAIQDWKWILNTSWVILEPIDPYNRLHLLVLFESLGYELMEVRGNFIGFDGVRKTLCTQDTKWDRDIIVTYKQVFDAIMQIKTVKL